jgi:hypothetical protein
MVRVRVIVLNNIFNNISVIWWWSVLLLDETAVSGENNRHDSVLHSFTNVSYRLIYIAFDSNRLMYVRYVSY